MSRRESKDAPPLAHISPDCAQIVPGGTPSKNGKSAFIDESLNQSCTNWQADARLYRLTLE